MTDYNGEMLTIARAAEVRGHRLLCRGFKSSNMIRYTLTHKSAPPRFSATLQLPWRWISLSEALSTSGLCCCCVNWSTQRACNAWVGDRYTDEDGLRVQLKPGPRAWWQHRRRQVSETESQETGRFRTRLRWSRRFSIVQDFPAEWRLGLWRRRRNTKTAWINTSWSVTFSPRTEFFSICYILLSASLYVSKRGAYWDRLCRDVVGRWLVVTRMHCGQTVHPRPIVTMEH